MAVTGTIKVSPTSTLVYGGKVYFDWTVSPLSTTSVEIIYTQNGVVVALGHPVFQTGTSGTTKDGGGLSAPGWTSGAADGIANLRVYSKAGKMVQVATVSFHVDA